MEKNNNNIHEAVIQSLIDNMEAYVEFVHETVYDPAFSTRVKEQLPFVGVVNAHMETVETLSLIKKMGLSVMRMNSDGNFAIGVTMKIANRPISEFLRLEESYTGVIIYVGSDKFKKDIIKVLKEQLKEGLI